MLRLHKLDLGRCFNSLSLHTPSLPRRRESSGAVAPCVWRRIECDQKALARTGSPACAEDDESGGRQDGDFLVEEKNNDELGIIARMPFHRMRAALCFDISKTPSIAMYTFMQRRFHDE